MSYPENLKYSKEHEWVRSEGKVATIGITQFAQDSLGDVVYVELPAAGKKFSAMEEMGVLESVKSVSSLYCPVGGTVIEKNPALESRPELINQSPYDQGWMVKIEMSNPTEADALLSSAAYQKILK
jgi:glycine cleavage system H protein